MDTHYERNRPTVWKGDITRQTAAQEYPLGTVREYYENKYVYCKAGSTALDAAKICCMIPTASTLVEIQESVPTTAVGSTSILITADATWTVDQYRDGYLWVFAGTAIGECHRIAGHNAVASASSTEIHLCEPLVTATATADSDVSMMMSPYRAIVVAPTTAVGEEHAVCVPQVAITASYYFWGLKEGFGALLLDAAGATVGEDADDKQITASGNHAGFGLIATPAEAATSPDGLQSIGWAVGGYDYIDNEAALVHIML